MPKLGNYIEKKHIPLSRYKSDKDLEAYGVSNTKGIIKTDHVKSSDLSKYLVIKPGYFAYNPYRVNVGSIGLTPQNIEGLVSPAYVVFKAKEGLLIPEILLDLLKSQMGLFLINKYATGTVRKALRFDDLCNIDINFPEYSKQIEIFEKIKRCNDLQKEITRSLNYSKILKEAILKEAFNN